LFLSRGDLAGFAGDRLLPRVDAVAQQLALPLRQQAEVPDDPGHLAVELAEAVGIAVMGQP
jgi:hypothetical protein